MPLYPSQSHWLDCYRRTYQDFKPKLANIRLRVDDLSYQVKINKQNRSYRYDPLREILGNHKMSLTKALNYFEGLSNNANEEIKATTEYQECLKFIEGIELYLERVALLSREVNKKLEGI
ncbi:hypothetical protein OGZ51_07175 [Lactococcus lactis]|uniref:Uncharacterized protein n=1 Tax=Lactococcus lactis TaxID=1358 RepID=A0A9X4NIA1_9LACT|nr:hypothetical protein [Lactococcus lactis]MDG4983922.1 hypothetical protein [Lactococcus lactis]